MSRHALLVLFGLIFAIPGLAAEGDIGVGVQLGTSVPAGHFTESAAAGLVGGLGVTFMQSERLGIGLDLAFHRWAGSDKSNALAVGLLGSGSEFGTNAVQTTVHALYDFKAGGPARPYLEAAAGVYWMMSWIMSPSGDTIDGDRTPMFGYNVGVGMMCGCRSLCRVLIGGAYHVIPVPGHILPSAYSTNFVTVGVGVVWGLGG